MTHLRTLFSPPFRPGTLILPGILALSSVTMIAKAYSNYQRWLAMGPGGVPYNTFGWAIQSTSHVITNKDLYSTGIYTDPKTIKQYGEHGDTRFLKGELKQREGPAVRATEFVAP